MADTRSIPPFIEPVAVEAWDAWFRWRHRTGLRDVSIEDTWRRVAGALAAVEGAGERAPWLSRFLHAFTTWQLLPDARVLATAGTGEVGWRGDSLGAVVNVAAFVARDSAPGRRIDLPAISCCAEIAVRALDNAALLADSPAPRLRIGLTGVADALAILGLGYDSDAGREQAGAAARALAEGCICASMELAIERGVNADGIDGVLERALTRGLSPDILRAVKRHGLRHHQLTAITSTPRLALLANDVADALDPLLGENHPHTITTAGGQRTTSSSGYALSVLSAAGRVDDARTDTLASVGWVAQIAMRAAVQPWMDEPIAYPLLLDHHPDSRQVVELLRQASLHGLTAPTWRVPAAPPSRDSPTECEPPHLY